MCLFSLICTWSFLSSYIFLNITFRVNFFALREYFEPIIFIFNILNNVKRINKYIILWRDNTSYNNRNLFIRFVMFIQWIRVDLSHAFKSFQLTIVFTLSGMDYAFYRMFYEWFIFNIQEVSKSFITFWNISSSLNHIYEFRHVYIALGLKISCNIM